jgi:hypothetical protein
MAITLLILTNVLPDYVSLLESRWMSGLIQRLKHPVATVMLLCLDGTITLGIGVVVTVVAYMLFLAGDRHVGLTQLADAGPKYWVHSIES